MTLPQTPVTTSTLWEALREVKSNPPKPNPDIYTNRTRAWLDKIGLKVNPFSTWDAAQDPFIPFYLVDHNQYSSINGNFTSFMFAPPGSGKSAFRVRLARDCRIGMDNRKIFPIIYNIPPNLLINRSYGADEHFDNLAKLAAKELLLLVSYHIPFFSKDEDLLVEICRLIFSNISADYCNQMLSKGTLQPLLDGFDPTAGLLPNPPEERELRNFMITLIGHRPLRIDKGNAKFRFEQIISLLLQKLGYDAIYILVDGVDAYVETGTNPYRGVQAISWLLENNTVWLEKRIFVKYFLPDDMEEPLKEIFPYLLTPENNVTIIWNVEALCDVVRQRLWEASGGRYNSLRAISSLPLRGAVQPPEERLAREVVTLGNANPRDLVKAVNWLLLYHVQHEEKEKLTPKDLVATIDWLRKEQFLRRRHT